MLEWFPSELDLIHFRSFIFFFSTFSLFRDSNIRISLNKICKPSHYLYTFFFARIRPTLYIIHFLQLFSMKHLKYGYKAPTSKLDFIYCTKVRNISIYYRITSFLSFILYFQIQNAAFMVNYVVSISCCLLSNILYIIGSFQFVFNYKLE